MTKNILDIVQKPTYRHFEWTNYKQGSNPWQYSVVTDSPKRLNTIDISNHFEADTDWRLRIAKKQDATNQFSTSGWKNVVIPHAWQTVRINSSNTISTVHNSWFGQGLGLSDPVDTTLQDIAVKRAKRKLSEMVPQKQAIAPVVELRELRDLIRQFAEFSHKWVLALADIKRTKGKSAYKFASTAWISYGFGAAPMMNDIDEATKALIAYLERKDLVDRVVGSARKSWRESFVSDGTSGPAGYQIRAETEITHTLSYRYIYAFAVNWRSANDYTAADQFGLNFPSVLPALWELTAWSWLLDYFGTVGAWFDDTFTSDPTRCVYCVRNTRYIADVKVRLYHRRNNFSTDYVGMGGEPGYGGAQYFRFKRDLQPTLPNRIIRFKTVDEIGGPNATDKLLNLVSLLLMRR